VQLLFHSTIWLCPAVLNTAQEPLKNIYTILYLAMLSVAEIIWNNVKKYDHQQIICWKGCITHSGSWALLEKLPVMQLLKNFPTFYGTRRFIIEFTRALQWSLSPCIQSNWSPDSILKFTLETYLPGCVT
jgi:prolipoprotein diacylglyceryltransferase